MIRGVLLAGLVAGLIAGLVVTLAQMVRVTPLILQAETYETAAEGVGSGHGHGQSAQGTADDSAAAAAEHSTDAWAPADGIERTLFTALANIITGIGFALLLVAVFAFRGIPMNYRHGIEWGLAGFAIFSLAPALGLPPELPGIDTADLLARQTWWLGTVIATGGGLGLLILRRQLWMRIAGVVLIAIPHVIGAPHPATSTSAVPAELAAQFAVASLVTAALFWIVLGGLCGHLYARFVEQAALATAER